MPRTRAAARSRAFGPGLRLLMRRPGVWADESGRLKVKRHDGVWNVWADGLAVEVRWWPTLAAAAAWAAAHRAGWVGGGGGRVMGRPRQVSDDDLRRLAGRGLTRAEMARELGVSYVLVWTRLPGAGVASPPDVRGRRPSDLTDQRFGRLTAVRLAGRRPASWLCRCRCGREKVVAAGCLTGGGVRSCGCLSDEVRRGRIPAQRNASILAAARAGRTFAGIAADVGISAERVRQIVRRHEAATRPAVDGGPGGGV